MTANSPDDGVMRRLKKLLAMAMDGRGNSAEAENAMRMAQKLMAAHGLSEGALAASEVDEFRVATTRADTPPSWESALLHQVCRAFGARFCWSPGAGPKGCRAKGSYIVIAPKVQLELIKYATEVLRRQLIKARAEYVAGLPVGWTRPRKAQEGDAFGIGFAHALSKKISDYVGDAAVAEAIKLRYDGLVEGRKAKQKKLDNPDPITEARAAGASAAAQASLHRAMNGAGEGPLRIAR
jgi:Protein of unknown function (DUF2786)